MNDNLFYLTLTLSIIAVLVSGVATYNALNYPDVDTSGIDDNAHLISVLQTDSARTTIEINNLMNQFNGLDLMDEDDLDDLQDDIDDVKDDVDDNEDLLRDMVECYEDYVNHTPIRICIRDL